VVVRHQVKGRYKRRSTYHIEGLSKGMDIGTFNSDINALEKAVKERILFVKDGNGGFCKPPKPALGAYPILLEKYKTLITGHAKTSPLTNEQFLGAYEGRKHTIYSRAIESLTKRPLCGKDAEVKYFMKVEKVNFTSKPDSVCRGISPRSPRFHVSLGPYIKRIEKLVYRQIDDIWGSPTVMKGYNSQQRGKHILAKWRKLKDPVAIGIDASRFDQHVSEDALRFEHEVYKSYFTGPHKAKLSAMLRRQLRNKGVGYAQDGKLKFHVEGVRMSGDMNTSLGNVLLMCMITHDMKAAYSLDFDFVNDGDDGVIFIERRHLRRLSAIISNHYLKYGFNVVLEAPVYELEHIEFCQCRPIMVTENECLMVRNVETSFDKDCCSVLPLNSTSGPKWARAVGECGLSLAGCVPVLSEFYKTLTKYSNKKIKLYSEGLTRLSEGMDMRRQVHHIARYSYWKAFGVPPDKQLAIEEYYRKCEVHFNKTTCHYQNNPTLHLL